MYEIECPTVKVYQAFRWWGIGTLVEHAVRAALVYQAFRWWGIGTVGALAL